MSGASSSGGIVTRSPREQLLGRQREREVLERLLRAARDGHGGVLVLHGEPGVGKTALLEYAVETGREFRVARTVGVEGEMELAFAALQQLCSPSLVFFSPSTVEYHLRRVFRKLDVKSRTQLEHRVL